MATSNSDKRSKCLPQGMRTRIRALQTHRNKVEVAQPGSRVAINLASVTRTDLERGNIVALPGQLHPTMLIDAHIQLLADAPRPLTHNTLVDFYSGSQEVPARVSLLDVEELKPGQSAWVQLRLSHPAVLARRDRFILRIPSPSITIGGGEVVDVQPRYHRRFQPAVLNHLQHWNMDHQKNWCWPHWTGDGANRRGGSGTRAGVVCMRSGEACLRPL